MLFKNINSCYWGISSFNAIAIEEDEKREEESRRRTDTQENINGICFFKIMFFLILCPQALNSSFPSPYTETILRKCPATIFSNHAYREPSSSFVNV